MTIELNEEERQRAIESLMRYAAEHLDERMGNIAASGLLGFFVQEVGPLIYNRAVADVQNALLARVQEVDIELHKDAFTYWQQAGRSRKSR
jgi:uncharacterized protein (DUF2164 family)